MRFTEQWTVDKDDDVLVAVLGAHGPAWTCHTDQVSGRSCIFSVAMRVKRCVEQCFARHFWYKSNSVPVAASTSGFLLSAVDDDGKMQNDGAVQLQWLPKDE